MFVCLVGLGCNGNWSNMSDEGGAIPNLHLETPTVTLEQRYEGTNVTEEDIERQNAFESGVRSRMCASRSCILPFHAGGRQRLLNGFNGRR